MGFKHYMIMLALSTLLLTHPQVTNTSVFKVPADTFLILYMSLNYYFSTHFYYFKRTTEKGS